MEVLAVVHAMVVVAEHALILVRAEVDSLL